MPSTLKRILLIEDNPGHCELLKVALGQEGVEAFIQIYPDAESPLALLQSQAGMSGSGLPHLILLDMKLKGMPGVEFARRLKADSRLASIPIVMLTTSDHRQDIEVCYAAGASGYVVKPGTFDELTVLVHDLCKYWLHWNRTPHSVESKC